MMWTVNNCWHSKALLGTEAFGVEVTVIIFSLSEARSWDEDCRDIRRWMATNDEDVRCLGKQFSGC